MKKIFYLMAVLALGSCYTIQGTYINQEERLTLRTDSTFEYFYNLGWHKKYAVGVWSRLGKKSLVVEESIYPGQVPVEVSAVESSGCGLVLNVTGLRDTSAMNFLRFELLKDDTVVLNLKPFERVDLPEALHNGVVRLRISIPADEIRPFVLNRYLYTKKIETDCSSSGKTFTISVPLDIHYFYLQPIERDTLVLKGNRILWKKRTFKKSREIIH